MVGDNYQLLDCTYYRTWGEHQETYGRWPRHVEKWCWRLVAFLMLLFSGTMSFTLIRLFLLHVAKEKITWRKHLLWEFPPTTQPSLHNFLAAGEVRVHREKILSSQVHHKKSVKISATLLPSPHPTIQKEREREKKKIKKGRYFWLIECLFKGNGAIEGEQTKTIIQCYIQWYTAFKAHSSLSITTGFKVKNCSTMTYQINKLSDRWRWTHFRHVLKRAEKVEGPDRKDAWMVVPSH